MGSFLSKAFSWPDNGFAGGAVKKGFNKFGKALEFPQASETYHAGQDTLAAGNAITDAGIAGINSDVAGDQASIASGGLTPALRRSFDVARGAVLDRATAQRNGLQSSLAQRALESGGVLSDAARAEIEAGANNEIGANEFSATNDVNAGEASAGMQATQAALSRISDARRSVLGAGAARSGLGGQLQMGALDVMLQRRKAVGSTLASFGSIGGGGFH